jgi:hypothetical protein
LRDEALGEELPDADHPIPTSGDEILITRTVAALQARQEFGRRVVGGGVPVI